MNSGRYNEPSPGFSLADIYFVVFRHKWKIVILTLLGVAAAAAFYFTNQPPFQSDAEILIRYISDTHPISPTENNSQVIAFNQEESIIQAETHLLQSYDLFEQVATNVGPEKILAKLGGGADPIAAASAIQGSFRVIPEGSVIHLTYRNPDPSIVQRVLEAIVNAYLDKHNQVHSAIDISADSLMEQTTALRQQIAQTDEELRVVKAGANIIDVADSEKSYSEEISQVRQQLFQAQAELAERQASFNATQTANTNGPANSAASQPAPPEQLQQYKTVCLRLLALQRKEIEYLYQNGFTEQNKLVMEGREQMAAANKIKADLEAKYPSLASLDFSATAPADNPAAGESASDTAASAREISALPIRIKTLQGQLAQIQAEAAKLGEAETKIADLERKRQIQEDHYKYFASSLDEENINAQLGPGKNSNIPQIQSPTPPYKDFAKFHKTLYGMIFGGLMAGLAWAFLIEFYLDRSIKRPIDIQAKLKIPFFLSIPDLNQNSRRGLASAARKQLEYKNGAPAENGGATPVKLEVMAWEVNRRFNSYYDALRDRLVVYFESINLTRKPKLVAVTSTHKGAGVSTIASGLASSLSETGDGRVLLVDMNLENGAARQFFRGKPSCKLDDALESEKRDNALVQENLYVVTEDTISDRLPRALPKRFAALIPKLKASDYDYIIFDMPPVSPTSVTSRLAGFMDTVMLVIESEKTDQQVVQQANALLAQSKANVTAVLNKTKHYIPSRLHQDFLSDV